MKKLLFLILLISVRQIYACDCKEMTLLQNQSVSKSVSKIIFIGKLISYDVNSEIYVFHSLEVLKGIILHDTIQGRIVDSCSGFPMTEGKWIIYADSINDGFIDFSQCGMSRPFSKPENSKVQEYIVGLPQIGAPSDTNLQELEKVHHRAVIDLQLEIDALRSYK